MKDPSLWGKPYGPFSWCKDNIEIVSLIAGDVANSCKKLEPLYHECAFSEKGYSYGPANLFQLKK